MFKTSEGETLELAPWRMRRFVRLLADARRYPAGTPPHVLIQDLRQIIARARRVKTEPRIGTARFQSAGACCNACLLAQQRDGVLALLGVSFAPVAVAAIASGLASPEPEFESPARSASLSLDWKRWATLDDAVRNASGPGVYMLKRGARPVYVGKSLSLQRRLAHHLWCARSHRDNTLSVWTANVPATRLAAVEHTLVRALQRRLTNTQLQQPMDVGSGGLAITNLLPGVMKSRNAPNNQAIRSRGQTYEWSA
ncbi:hypothetical protein [Paraburkholderia humisilvae]|uniref:GIY-YIG domain-containing protein n=1 Tax=Paraburkholderia humisilvae TaxID=627669 RepID=A0A6J5D078_9BURK|nr:hypothetical protein [Paraburkholderia humisilvae]CAB3746076.1 hypothetical protein LMG29542_00117 [Paraburkholderia humisilvae]